MFFLFESFTLLFRCSQTFVYERFRFHNFFRRSAKGNLLDLFLWKRADSLHHTGGITLLSCGEPSEPGTKPTLGEMYCSLVSALLTV